MSTLTYITDFESVLQDRLDHPTNWKETVNVKKTNARIISSSYWSTTPSVQTVTRETAFSFQNFTETADTLTISTGRDLGIYVDFADLAQSPWTTKVAIYDRIGALINEFIETNIFAQNASWTDFFQSSIVVGGGAGNITISANNVDDICRALKRRVRKNNGFAQMRENGLFIEWRPEDFEYLEAFAQANGFQTADEYLKNGFAEQVKYMGVNHYWNESEQTANHLFAGVRKQQRLGILLGTYGKMHDIELPAGSSNNNLSGMGYYSRVDIGHMTPGTLTGNVFDINVADVA